MFVHPTSSSYETVNFKTLFKHIFTQKLFLNLMIFPQKVKWAEMKIIKISGVSLLPTVLSRLVFTLSIKYFTQMATFLP